MPETRCLTSLESLALEMGVEVRSQSPPHGWWGAYDHRRRVIFLKPGLGYPQRRSTLAHELGHAHYGHHGHSPKHEQIADRWAAQELLTVDELLEHARFTVDVRDLSASLDVMPWVVGAFVETMSESSVRHLLAELRDHYIA